MAKTLLEEALADAKVLKKTAIENAKNVLVEAISPKIKEFVESQLGEDTDPQESLEAVQEDPQEDEKVMQHMKFMDPAMAGLDMGLNGMQGDVEGANPPMAGMGTMNVQPQAGLGAPSMGVTEAEHGDEAEDLKLMKKVGILGDDGEDESSGDDKGDDEDSEEMEHDEKEDKKEKKEDSVDEVVNITNEDLKAALSEAIFELKTEAKVSKGFGDAEDATIPASGGPGAKGLADEKGGEHHWKDETPPAAKDWTIKEAKRVIGLLQKENKALKTEVAEYKAAFSTLKRNLQEVNLFNSKLLYTQKLLNISELNSKQRLAVIEAFDRAGNLREVELVYKSLSESFKIAGVLTESKQARANGARSSRMTTPSSSILREAVVKEEAQKEGDDMVSRWQVLSGLVD